MPEERFTPQNRVERFGSSEEHIKGRPKSGAPVPLSDILTHIEVDIFN